LFYKRDHQQQVYEVSVSDLTLVKQCRQYYTFVSQPKVHPRCDMEYRTPKDPTLAT